VGVAIVAHRIEPLPFIFDSKLLSNYFVVLDVVKAAFEFFLVF